MRGIPEGLGWAGMRYTGGFFAMLTKLGLGDEWDEIKETSFSVQNQPGAQEPQDLRLRMSFRRPFLGTGLGGW